MGVVLEFKPKRAEVNPQLAYKTYIEASKLDEDPTTMDEAASLYHRAIMLDPTLSIAYTNLGNIFFRRHDSEGAEKFYKEALSWDPYQPEAQYNMGYLLLESGRAEESIPMFAGSLTADPKFADAHFNLAMAFERLGEVEKAQPHWRRYIELEPSGTWTEIALRHITNDHDQSKSKETGNLHHLADPGQGDGGQHLGIEQLCRVSGAAPVQEGSDIRRGEGAPDGIQDLVSAGDAAPETRQEPQIHQAVRSGKKINFGTMIYVDQLKALKKLSKKTGVSMAEHTRNAIDNYLQTEEEHADG